MIDQHPITPSPDLVQQWLGTYFGTTVTGEVSKVELAHFTQAARWGADQELEECWRWMRDEGYRETAQLLHAARRPKPPSLKEQALAALRQVGNCEEIDNATFETIRRALEALPND
jgi:hypothetical protein